MGEKFFFQEKHSFSCFFEQACFSITGFTGKDIRKAMKKATVWASSKEDSMARYMEPKLDLR